MHTYGITFATSSITTTILLTKISHAMFIISPRVVNTINSLPVADREPISRALSREFILGEDPELTLTVPPATHSTHAAGPSADDDE